MSPVYVSASGLPIVLEVADGDPAEVADMVEDWCDRSEVTTIKRLPDRFVVNWGQITAVRVSTLRDPEWSPDAIIPYTIQIIPDY